MRIFLLLTLFIVNAGCRCGSDKGTSSQTAIDSVGECSIKTPDQWQAFIERYSGDARWVDTCEDSECNEAYVDTVRRDIQQVFSRCAKIIEENKAIKACTANFRRFVPAWIRQHDEDSYGFALSNHDYFKDQESPDKPASMMVIPQEIVEAIPSRAKVESVARLNGWKYITHDSGLSGVRTFVYIPDPKGRFDRWMLLNLVDDPNVFDLKIPLSFIAVQKKDASGKKLDAVRVYFRDYLVSNDNGHITTRLPEDRNGKCFSCHPSGTRNLIDRKTKITEARPVKGESGFDPSSTAQEPREFGRKRLSEFNAILLEYGIPDWNRTIDPENFGPALGSKLGCAGCHDGTTRGPLTVITSMTQLRKRLVEQLSMPPDPKLVRLLEKSEMRPKSMTSAEQTQLGNAVKSHQDMLAQFAKERSAELTAWLLEANCRAK